MTTDEAALREIDQLRQVVETQARAIEIMQEQLEESERQRKQLSEYIETLAKGGIEAATGAGK